MEGTMAQAVLQVTVVSPAGVLFEGAAKTVICPGEQGTFELLPFHRPLVSRLMDGLLEVDERAWPISRGIAQVVDDRVTIIAEL
jgi:F-type H+-transporting ATPase subunit epsilon